MHIDICALWDNVGFRLYPSRSTATQERPLGCLAANTGLCRRSKLSAFVDPSHCHATPSTLSSTFLARAVFAAAVSFACTAQAGLWEAVVDTTPAATPVSRLNVRAIGPLFGVTPRKEPSVSLRRATRSGSFQPIPTIQPGLGKNGMKKTVIPMISISQAFPVYSPTTRLSIPQLRTR